VVFSNGGKKLNISWETPFTHPGFDISHYTLELFNTTDNSSIVVNMGMTNTYTASIDSLPRSCSEMVYTVTAFNSLGSNSNNVSTGFPISYVVKQYIRILKNVFPALV